MCALGETAGRRIDFSIEVVPPSRGAGLFDLFTAIEAIMPHAPISVSVTDHPGGWAYVDSEKGPCPVPLRGKPGTLGAALAIGREFGVRTVPHIVASGAGRFSTEDLLIDLDYAGFREVFVVRGDERFSRSMACSDQAPPHAEPRYRDATELVAHIAALNRGEYLPPAERGAPTAFRIGVAGYPEKHYAAPNRDADIRQLKAKVDAGAMYIVTQMLFDARHYFDFVARLREAGIALPVIPGLKPITRAAQARALPGAFFIDIPDTLLCALEDARSPEGEKRAGIAWTVRLAEELLMGGAPGLHFFTMGRGAATRAVLDALCGAKVQAKGGAA